MLMILHSNCASHTDLADGVWTTLAKLKSASFGSPASEMSRLFGFTSLEMKIP